MFTSQAQIRNLHNLMICNDFTAQSSYFQAEESWSFPNDRILQDNIAIPTPDLLWFYWSSIATAIVILSHKMRCIIYNVCSYKWSHLPCPDFTYGLVYHCSMEYSFYWILVSLRISLKMLSMLFGHDRSLGLYLHGTTYKVSIKFLLEVQTQDNRFYFKLELIVALHPWLCTYHILTFIGGRLLPLHPFRALHILTVWGQIPKDSHSWMVVLSCSWKVLFLFVQ